MGTTTDIPESAIAIRTYREIRQFAAKFAAEAFNLLAVMGPPGTGKSQTFEQVMSGRRHLLLYWFSLNWSSRTRALLSFHRGLGVRFRRHGGMLRMV